ncbi:MAG: YeeE/YedE family protein [Sphingomonadales bacterium]|nr:YeeE/YedE family protein [Sphingomonadales bacterium]MDE2170394.1 YeeE/YedE family protein [Sphingomonadales bacterium]
MNPKPVVALAAGVLFGAGLAVSGMVDPARVLGFLDIAGRWDPTLAFVMGGAMLPMMVAWRIRANMMVPVAADRFHEPVTLPITISLIAGALLFGIGWGLSGLCPGPALADVALVPASVLPFLIAMLAGFGLHRIMTRLTDPARPNPPQTRPGA